MGVAVVLGPDADPPAHSVPEDWDVGGVLWAHPVTDKDYSWTAAMEETTDPAAKPGVAPNPAD